MHLVVLWLPILSNFLILLANASISSVSSNAAAMDFKERLAVFGISHVLEIFDYDGKGYLVRMELEDMIQHVLVEGNSLADDTIQDLVALIGPDSQGHVTMTALENFVQHMGRGTKAQASQSEADGDMNSEAPEINDKNNPFPVWEMHEPKIRGDPPGVHVTIREGPVDCDPEERVKKYDLVEFSYKGMISIDSKVGERRKMFYDGEQFNNTWAEIGFRRVIRGWDEGFIGLCVGNTASLTVPPDMGYGDYSPSSAVPGGATLDFVVQIVSTRPAPKEPNVFQAIDQKGNSDGRLTFLEIQNWFEPSGNSPPDNLMLHEDKNYDGVVSWLEFTGPKGRSPPQIVDGKSVYPEKGTRQDGAKLNEHQEL